MRYCDTVASKCTYGDILGKIIKDAEIIYEDSYEDEDDYDGHGGSVHILAQLPDSKFFYYHYFFDTYELYGGWSSLSDLEIEAEMRRESSVMDMRTAATFIYNHPETEMKDAFNSYLYDSFVCN
jgi:hypothetical protein